MDVQPLECNAIAGLGNPLVDLSATVGNIDFLHEFNLNPDGHKEVISEELDKILAVLERENYEITCNPGGCAQNTLRIMQTLVKKPSFSVFFGGLGDDHYGKLLETELRKSGVDTRYTIHTSYSTGKTVALINGENRSLVANLGAAEVYTVGDFATNDNMKIFQDIMVVYIEGFFITHSFEVALEAINISRSQGAVITFNISGAYVADHCPKELLHMANCADVVMGNITEFKALAKIMGIDNNLTAENLALKIHSVVSKLRTQVKFKLKQFSSLGKTLVITQGKGPVICVSEGQGLIKHEVPYLDPKLVVDPTGAGDAFSAGFLLGLIQSKCLTECLAYGCDISQKVIQNIGVRL